MSTSEKLKGNKNAEKWTLEEAELFFINAIELSREYEFEKDTYKYDFIGEVARQFNSYKEVFTYLKDKFTELKSKHTELISNLEANCFYNSKKGKINTAIGIVNLKSNHGWTDRVDNTVKADVKVQSIKPIEWVEDAKD